LKITNRITLMASTALSFLRIGPGRTAPSVRNPPAPAPAARKPGRSDDKAKPGRKHPVAPNPDDDDEDDDGEGDPDTDRDELAGRKGKKKKAARSRERARIATILSHPAAAANPEFAAHLALNTPLDRAAACKVLATAPVANGTTISIADRMARAKVQQGVAPKVRRSSAASWDDAVTLSETGKIPATSAPASSWDSAMIGLASRP
jgi:hypothetical protein